MMLPAIRLGGKDADGNSIDIVYFDFGSFVRIEGTTAQINLPESPRPRFHDDGLFGMEYARVNPSCIGVSITPAELQETWADLEANGWPLQDFLVGLVMHDFTESLVGVPSQKSGFAHQLYRSLPSFSVVVELVGLIGEIRTHDPSLREGFESRVMELRKHLRTVFRRVKPGEPSWTAYNTACGNAQLATSARVAEFEILRRLLGEGQRCQLPKSGSDFILPNVGSVRVEVKARYENIIDQVLDLYAKPKGGRAETIIVPEVFLTLAAWTAFGSVKRAMDNQKADIMFCDLSHTFAGQLLSAVSQFWNLNRKFSTVLNHAIEIVKSGKNAVVVYASAAGLHPIFESAAFTREEIDALGKPLWNANKSIGFNALEIADLVNRVWGPRSAPEKP